MRVINTLLHLLIVTLLFCAANLHAQTQGLLPTVIDSLNSGADGVSCGLHCITQQTVNTGNLIVVAVVQPDVTYGGACPHNSNGPTWTVTDSLGTTYTSETTAVTPTGGGLQDDYIGIAHGVATASGADNITVALGSDDCQEQIYIARATNISGTKDAITTATAGPSSTPVTATTNTTTTVNGDLLFGFAALNSGPAGLMGLGPTLQFLGSKGTVGPEVNASFGFTNGGLAGSESQSTIRYGGNNFGSSVMQTIAFKPTAIAIVDTDLPGGALLSTYKATIHGVGGAGAYTCSITAGSLQAGLSLGGSGNCTISGTPSASSTNSITFQISDGTLTATKTLSLAVAGGFGSPYVVSQAQGNFDNGGSSANVTVACGDIIALQLAPGADTHGSTGWIQTQNGLTDYYLDSFGTAFTRVPGVGGIISGGLHTYIGQVTQSGIDVITGHNGEGNSAALEYQISVVRGVQPIADYGSFNNNITTANSTTTLTTTFVAPVSNEILLSTTLDENTGSSISLGAPFSSTASGNDGFNEFNFGVATGQAAGSISHAASITSNIFHTQSTQLFGLRPGNAPSFCGAFTGSGEKLRRGMN